MDDENVYCMWVSLVAGLLSLLGIIIFSKVWPIVSLKLKEEKKKSEKFNLNVKRPNQFQLSQISNDEKGSLLSATLALAETRQSTSYYKLLCPVYIAKPDVILEKEEESAEIELDINTKKDEAPIRVKLEAVPEVKQLIKERKSPRKTKPRTKKSTSNRSKKTRSKKRTSRTQKQKSKRVSSSSSGTDSSSTSLSSSSDSDSSSSSEPMKTVSLKRRSKKKSSPRKKTSTEKKAVSQKKLTSKQAPAEKQVVIKEDAQDVKTKLIIHRDPKDKNKLDIDYDMIVDPNSKQPMEVHTHAEVDEDKMNVIGTAEAEGAGYADVEGTIQHKGAKDQDDFRLDVTNKNEDKKEISLQATLKQKQNKMNEKKM